MRGDMRGDTFGDAGEGMERGAPPGGTHDDAADAAQLRAEAGIPEVGLEPGSEPRTGIADAYSGAGADIAARDTQPPASPHYADGPPLPPPYTPGRPLTPPRPAPRPPIPPGPRERHGIPWYAWAIAAVLGALLLLVVGCCALSGLAFGLLGHMRSGPEQTETTTKTFAVSGAPSLMLHNPAGAITIAPGAGNAVVVQATKRVRDQFGDDARAELNAIDVQMSQSGATVSVTVRFPTAPKFGGDRSVDLDITTPAITNLTADSAAGNLTLGAIVGQIVVTANAGNVEATGTTFSGASRVNENAGNVTLDGAIASGTTLTVKVNAGNVTVRLPANTPAHLSARASVGAVTVSGWPIAVSRLNVTGASATGDLNPNPTATLMVTVDSGNATIEAH